MASILANLASVSVMLPIWMDALLLMVMVLVLLLMSMAGPVGSWDVMFTPDITAGDGLILLIENLQQLLDVVLALGNLYR